MGVAGLRSLLFGCIYLADEVTFDFADCGHAARRHARVSPQPINDLRHISAPCPRNNLTPSPPAVIPSLDYPSSSVVAYACSMTGYEPTARLQTLTYSMHQHQKAAHWVSALPLARLYGVSSHVRHFTRTGPSHRAVE